MGKAGGRGMSCPPGRINQGAMGRHGSSDPANPLLGINWPVGTSEGSVGTSEMTIPGTVHSVRVTTCSGTCNKTQES